MTQPDVAPKKFELHSSLGSSCDELRGGMDASQYKDNVLVLWYGTVESPFALEEAQASGRPYARLKVLTHPAPLVVDEIGYPPMSRTGAMLFFQLMTRRVRGNSYRMRQHTDRGQTLHAAQDPEPTRRRRARQEGTTN